MPTIFGFFLYLCMLNIFSIHDFSQNSQPLIYEYAIQRIVDGDTLILSPKKGQSFRVRLYGIDCPEKRQEGGTAATEAAKNLASGQNVSMKSCYEDRYGRVVGIITFPDGTIMQEALLLQGHAWVDPHYCTAQIYDRWIILEKSPVKPGVDSGTIRNLFHLGSGEKAEEKIKAQPADKRGDGVGCLRGGKGGIISPSPPFN